MAIPFPRLSIYRKLLLGFSVVGGLSAVLAVSGIFQLYRIETITASLTPQMEASEYLQEASVILEALDSDFERYTTVGGQENRDQIETDLLLMDRSFSLVRGGSQGTTRMAEIDSAAATLSSLKNDMAAFISAEEEGRKESRNEHIVKIYSALDSLRAGFASLRKGIDSEFRENLTAQSANVTSAINQLIIFELVIIVLGGIMTVLLSRAFTAPITTLTKVAAAFGEGKLEERVELATGDEIQQLGEIFNDMAGHLARYTGSLEEEVAKRTNELKDKLAELDASNKLLQRRESELTLVNERLLEIDKAKSEFLSVAAHQLRTPLSAIKWTLSLLIDEESENMTAEQKSLLMKGYESNERIISLINEMLVVTRIESGKVTYNFSVVHIDDIIDSVLLDFAGQFHVRKIKFGFERPREALPYINADPEKVRSVIQNLVENSIKYTHDGGAITVAASLVENVKIKVSVKDTGIGIPTRQQSSIFNKFFRADNAAKLQTDGSGLGLFIAKSIIEKHGGELWFESAEGVGSTFYFTIPIAASQGAPQAGILNNTPVAVQAAAPSVT